MNNIFLFDIDGTLSENGIIPISTKKTLALLKRNNIVMLSTGRTLGQFNDELKSLDINGAILNNGAYAIIDNKIVFESPISFEIINELRKDGLFVSYLADDDYFITEDDMVIADFANYFHITKPKLRSEEYLKKAKVLSLGVHSYDLDNLDTSKYPLKFVRTAPLGYDVMNLGISKATPIPFIRSKYPNAKIIAFGDNYNDIEMLMSADVKIVMGQAPKELKTIADFVTKKPLDDGIEYAVNEFLKEYI